MTIQIRVTNEDSRDTAVVGVSAINKSTLLPVEGVAEKVIKGGESATQWVYSDQNVSIREIQNG